MRTPCLQPRAAGGGSLSPPTRGYTARLSPCCLLSSPRGLWSLRGPTSAQQTAPLPLQPGQERSRGAKKHRDGARWLPAGLGHPEGLSPVLPAGAESHIPARICGDGEQLPQGGCDATERIKVYPRAGPVCARAGNRATRHLSTRSAQPQGCLSFLCRYTPTLAYPYAPARLRRGVSRRRTRLLNPTASPARFETLLNLLMQVAGERSAAFSTRVPPACCSSTSKFPPQLPGLVLFPLGADAGNTGISPTLVQDPSCSNTPG